MPTRASRLAIVGAVVSLVVVGGLTLWRSVVGSRPPGAFWAHELGVAPDAWLFGIGITVALVGAAAVLLTDRFPRVGVVVVAGVVATGWVVIFVPFVPVALPFAVAIILAVRRGATLWAGCALAGFLAAVVTVLAVVGAPRGFVIVSVMLSLALGVIQLLTATRRARRDRAFLALQHLEELARTRQAREREDMARELHDVLAHSLSSITVQAGVGLHLADREPAKATEALTAIRDTSRQALDDVRHMLGVLRGDASGPLVPEASLDALPTLIEGSAALGIAVRLDDALTPRPPTAIQSAMVRIVREALTNVARHAPGASVRVSLSRADGSVTVAILDGGAPSPSAPQPGAGLGIEGMRERVALLGGQLEVGPRGTGFAVVATFPESP